MRVLLGSFQLSYCLASLPIQAHPVLSILLCSKGILLGSLLTALQKCEHAPDPYILLTLLYISMWCLASSDNFSIY